MKLTNLKLVVLSTLFLFSNLFVINAQKITADQLIAKHLDSIATKEKRAEMKNQIVFMDVEFKQKGSTIPIKGKGLVLSADNKNLWGMNLASNDYPTDQFSFDGSNVNVGFTQPGRRSIIGGFILSYEDLLKEGLLGGTLGTSWSLLNIEKNKAKISLDGTKKIDGKETYVLSYSPKGGSDLTIKMYFDQKTFHHLRTEYSRVVAAQQGATIDTSAGQTPDRYKIVEDFSNYTKMGNLTLPGSYKIFYNYSKSATIREAEWQFNVTNYSFNQELDAKAFEINGK